MKDAKRRYRLTHRDLGFWVDVTVYEREGRYMATANLAEDSRAVGVGDTPYAAVRAALRSLGESHANEMAMGRHPIRARTEPVRQPLRRQRWRIATYPGNRTRSDALVVSGELAPEACARPLR